MTAHGRAVHDALIEAIEATDNHNTNALLAAGITADLARRGYRIVPLPDAELAQDEWNGLPREFCQYRAEGHDAHRALTDAVGDCDDVDSYAAMAQMLMVMLTNYGYRVGAESSWKGWNE
jgi:hypothetical protein